MNSKIDSLSTIGLIEAQDNSVTKCVQWLETISIDQDTESTCSDGTSFSKFSSDTDGDNSKTNCLMGNREVFLNNEVSQEEVQSVIAQSQNIYTNVKIRKSKNVHLGNVTYINGPVYINQTSTVINNQTTINQYVNVDDDTDSKPPFIVSRTYWLAQPPTSPYEYLSAPAKFVIISHSASEEGLTQPANVLLVRLIQQFHIESRYFDDIGYNFLIGADGNIYEGRGWNVVGAHTLLYNKIGIGICFIGCFTSKLPTSTGIKKAKQLIAYGVKSGFIDKEYGLLGHCQCCATESPGRMLFEELKTWERFDPNISVDNPSPFIN